MRKSIDYFLYEVRSLDDLPPAVGAAIAAALPDAALEGIVVIPPQEVLFSRKGWLQWLYRTHLTPPRTLVFARDSVVVVEAPPGEIPQTTIIPLDQLLQVDLRVVLLSSALRFSWAAGNGSGSLDKELIFNTVGERIIRRRINALRTKLSAGLDPAAAGEPALSLDALSTLPLKFYNYLRLSLLPGEAPQQFVYQPAITLQQGRFRQCLSPQRLLALTEHFLIVVEETVATLEPQYGMAMCWYPRRVIGPGHLVPEEAEDWGWFTLAIGSTGKRLRLPLGITQAAALQAALGAAVPLQAVAMA